MSKTYTITLSEAQEKSLLTVTQSVQEWIDNAVYERCRVAAGEIAKISLEKSLESSTALPTNLDDIVLLAFSNGWVKTVEQKISDGELSDKVI